MIKTGFGSGLQKGREKGLNSSIKEGHSIEGGDNSLSWGKKGVETRKKSFGGGEEKKKRLSTLGDGLFYKSRLKAK